MNFYRIVSIRHFTLLEVLIAMTLVLLCLVPLIYPHVRIAQEEQRFTARIEAARVASQLYVQTLEELYNGQLTWGEMTRGDVRSVDSFPLKIERSFRIVDQKPKSEEEAAQSGSVVLMEVLFRFGEETLFRYPILVDRRIAKNKEEGNDDS